MKSAHNHASFTSLFGISAPSRTLWDTFISAHHPSSKRARNNPLGSASGFPKNVPLGYATSARKASVLGQAKRSKCRAEEWSTVQWSARLCRLACPRMVNRPLGYAAWLVQECSMFNGQCSMINRSMVNRSMVNSVARLCCLVCPRMVNRQLSPLTYKYNNVRARDPPTHHYFIPSSRLRKEPRKKEFFALKAKRQSRAQKCKSSRVQCFSCLCRLLPTSA